jgi:hypothetical protein
MLRFRTLGLLTNVAMLCFFVGALESKAADQASDTTLSADLRTGRIDVSVLGGWSFGAVGQSVTALPVFNSYVIKGIGAASGGISVGVFLNPRVLFFGEGTFLNGAHQNTTNVMVPSLPNGVFTSVQTYTRAVAYNASIEAMLFPGRCALATKHLRLMPYVGGGVGTVQNRADVLDQFVFNPPVPPMAQSSFAYSARVRPATFALNSAFGVRCYLTKSFGLRIEAKGYFPTGAVKEPFARLSGGVFYQFR